MRTRDSNRRFYAGRRPRANASIFASLPVGARFADTAGNVYVKRDQYTALLNGNASSAVELNWNQPVTTDPAFVAPRDAGKPEEK